MRLGLIVGLLMTCLGCSTKYIQNTETYRALEVKYKKAKAANKEYESTLKTYKAENKSLKEQLDQALITPTKDTSQVIVNKAIPATPSKKYTGIETSLIRDINNNLSFKLKIKEHNFYVYKVTDPKTIQLFWKEDAQLISNLGKLQKIANSKNGKLLFGMNAGIFKPDRSPEGLFIQEGTTKVALNIKKGKGNFYLEPNGVFFIDKNGNAGVLSTKKYLDYAKTLATKDSLSQIHYATQSGPMLVADGKVHPVFNEPSTSTYVRNGVGVDTTGNVLFMISEKPVNLYTFASVFKDHFNCPNALYLDGAISKAYIPQLNKKELQGSFGPLIGVLNSQ